MPQAPSHTAALEENVLFCCPDSFPGEDQLLQDSKTCRHQQPKLSTRSLQQYMIHWFNSAPMALSYSPAFFEAWQKSLFIVQLQADNASTNLCKPLERLINTCLLWSFGLVIFDLQKAYNTVWRTHITSQLYKLVLIGNLARFLVAFFGELSSNNIKGSLRAAPSSLLY